MTAPLAVRRERARGDDAHGVPLGAGGVPLPRCGTATSAYARAGISVEPIVRVEDHLHAILPDLDALIPRLHRMFRDSRRDEHDE